MRDGKPKERSIRGGRGKCITLGKIGDYVKHIFREHNQEADHLANLGTEGAKRRY